MPEHQTCRASCRRTSRGTEQQRLQTSVRSWCLPTCRTEPATPFTGRSNASIVSVYLSGNITGCPSFATRMIAGRRSPSRRRCGFAELSTARTRARNRTLGDAKLSHNIFNDHAVTESARFRWSCRHPGCSSEIVVVSQRRCHSAWRARIAVPACCVRATNAVPSGRRESLKAGWTGDELLARIRRR